MNGANSAVVVALSEDNERLRRSNSMLLSELAHMKKLYNDIICFVQNHVVSTNNHSNAPSSLYSTIHHHQQQQRRNCYSASNFPVSGTNYKRAADVAMDNVGLNSAGSSWKSTVTAVDENVEEMTATTMKTCKIMKLFGVPLQMASSASKKRLNPEPSCHLMNLDKGDYLGLNLMPPRC
ncbi:hypothetical protein Droror1_Dr00010165 [Drosera rotundifolia]